MGNPCKIIVALTVISIFYVLFFVPKLELQKVVYIEPEIVRINATTTAEEKVIFKGCLGRANIWPSLKRIAYRNNFWVLYNHFKAKRRFECLESITYSTHGEFKFLENVLPVLERWQGPMSVAVFAPGQDFAKAVKVIMYYRSCTEKSTLVTDYVTFHLYFPMTHMPKNLTVPFSCDELLEDPSEWSSYRTENGLDYPINLGRIIARETATTHFIFASDIDLYPSSNLIPMFLLMIDTAQVLDKTVFVTPIFEIAERKKIPKNKLELVQAIKEQDVFAFHDRLCPDCDTLPFYNEWLQNTTSNMGRPQFSGNLSIFHTVKKRGRWQPFYIGTNEDPPYDERLTWEGMADKFTQGYLMCVYDYNFAILDNAFLVHKTDIKTKVENSKGRKSKKVAAQVNFIKQSLIPQLKILHGDNSDCSKV